MRSITSKREYRKVYLNNTRISGSLFYFLINKEIPDTPEDTCAVGIVVSKKVGNAVVRNKVKRRVRAFLRENRDLLPVGKRIVIIGRFGAGDATWKEFKTDLSKLFKRIK